MLQKKVRLSYPYSARFSFLVALTSGSAINDLLVSLSNIVFSCSLFYIICLQFVSVRSTGDIAMKGARFSPI